MKLLEKMIEVMKKNKLTKAIMIAISVMLLLVLVPVQLIKRIAKVVIDISVEVKLFFTEEIPTYWRS